MYSILGDAHSADKIMWNPHGNLSTLGDPSSRATAIAVLLEKHERKAGGKEKSMQCVSTSTITRPNGVENKNVASKVVSHFMIKLCCLLFKYCLDFTG